MIKENKRIIILTTLVTLLPMLAGLILWGRLPEKMPIHWNVSGELDGWAGKAFAVFAIPGFMAAAHLFCVLCTSLDPKVKNQTREVLWLVFWICPFVSVLVCAVMYAAALGAELNVASVVTGMCGVLYTALGNYLPKCRRNYTVGIKVMWALEDEANWNATHRFAGKLWAAGGIIVILAAFIPSTQWTFCILLAASILMALLPVIYSYLYYKKHGKTD